MDGNTHQRRSTSHRGPLWDPGAHASHIQCGNVLMMCELRSGKHAEVLHGLEAGVTRISHGRDLAFLVNMYWTPRHAILANCSAVVEAAVLHLIYPQAALYCLQPGNGHSHNHVGFPHWQRDLMHVHVQPDAVLGMSRPEEGATVLSMTWSHVRQGANPKAYDLLVVLAATEGSPEPLLLVENALLLGSQAIVSESLLLYGYKESSTATFETHQWHPAEHAWENFSHTYASHWEVYTQDRIMSGEQAPTLTSAEGGRIKVAYHMTVMGEYSDIVQQHFARLIFSGLYDIVEGIYCYILGPTEGKIEEARALVQRYGKKFMIAGTSTNLTLYERFTLLGIRDHLEPSDIFLYMHSKGVKPRTRS